MTTTTTGSTTTEWTTVPTSAGDLRALLHLPDATPTPRPGLVLVDGSGEGACDDWGGWPERLADRGVVVFTHDKPGCGGSPGNWIEQTIADRAADTIAALGVLRRHPAVAGQPVGLLGMSQGGWVSLLAAAEEPSIVDFVVSVSGPGVGPAAQERARIDNDLRASGLPEAARVEALAWIDERTRRLLAGEPVSSVLTAQERYADQEWYSAATMYFDNPVMLGYLARLLDFEPADVLPGVRCPVLTLFGADDTLVPVPESVAAFAAHLPRLPGNPHGMAVFPGANHGLFTADPHPDVPRTEQLAAGFLPMFGDFVGRVAARRSP